MISIKTNALEIKSVDSLFFDSIIKKKHYLRSANVLEPAVHMGFYYQTELVALMEWSAVFRMVLLRFPFLQHLEIIDNSRFLILQSEKCFFQKELPQIYNLGSRCLSLAVKWIPKVWQEKTRVKPKLLLTYVDTSRNFSGTVYKASNWKEIATTSGVLNKNSKSSPKRTFIYPLLKSEECKTSTEFTKEYLQKCYGDLNPTAQYNYKGNRMFTEAQKKRQIQQEKKMSSRLFFT